MVTLKTVAIAGVSTLSLPKSCIFLTSQATGNLGPQVLNALVKSGKFDITVLKRIGSESVIPHPVKVLEVDYNSLASLTAAVKGQDAVICTLAHIGPEIQERLVEASVTAGVKRFLPGEFGSVLNEATSQLPVFGNKVKVEKQLEAYAREGKITYTYVFNGPFLDWGLKTGFVLNMSQYKPEIHDGGDNLFSSTTIDTIGKAVVGILTHYEETKNRPVWIQDTLTSQNRLLAIAKKLTPGKKWETVPVGTAEMKAQSDANVGKGVFDLNTMYAYLYVANFGSNKAYGAHFQKLDNDMLGIKEKTEEEIETIIKTYLPKN
jgi:putative NADH-flavin reductase